MTSHFPSKLVPILSVYQLFIIFLYSWNHSEIWIIYNKIKSVKYYYHSRQLVKVKTYQGVWFLMRYKNWLEIRIMEIIFTLFVEVSITSHMWTLAGKIETYWVGDLILGHFSRTFWKLNIFATKVDIEVK
jgi:hypothetical protein